MSHLLERALLATVVTLMASQAWAKEPPRMKMTTETPPGIATPDKVKTRIGTLHLVDGVPDEATAQKIYDNLDSNGSSKYRF